MSSLVQSCVCVGVCACAYVCLFRNCCDNNVNVVQPTVFILQLYTATRFNDMFFKI